MATRKPRRKSKKEIMAAADRAEKRASGQPVEPPKSLVLEPEESKPALGRPTDFCPEYVEEAMTLCLRGATDEEIADNFGVSVKTIYRWKLKHEEFCQAIRVGKEYADDRVERGMYQRSTGFALKEQQAIKLKSVKYSDGKRVSEDERIEIVEVEKQIPPDTQAASLWLRNRRPDRWQDRSTKELTGAGGGPIEVSVTDKLALARWIALQLSGAATSETKAIDVSAG